MSGVEQTAKRVATAVTVIRNRGMVVVIDDADRENEGDLVMAAQYATPEAVNFAVTHARGLVCCAIAARIADALQLGLQEADNRALHGTNFTVSVDAAEGVTTGISVHDRALTLRLVADRTTAPSALARPGHIFPIVADSRGLRGRRGHTEAAVLLAELAELEPAAMICEILDASGAAAGHTELLALARRFDMPVVSVAELVQYEQLKQPQESRI
ncbi:MAG: 3,4-dihydroxy-2-butanone-4-phosphate synthase [Spirochaetaceae bacterium]|nr:MAG: 3,4-dihydroxy-2-butanone-4-phosphate synthase [Spirochaetaceae bacterium]